MRRFRLLYVAPTVLLLVSAIVTFALGSETLVYRDVLTSHYPLKAAQENLLDAGHPLPLVDPWRTGEPLLGNLNALVLYPTSALLLVSDALWTLNAHFWIHLLLAPWLGSWLGRAWGLSRPAAWAVGVVYASSGFFLSTMNLYNVVAGAALAPGFVAACLDATARRLDGRSARGRWIAAALLAALLVLAGDPTLGLSTFALGALAVALRATGRPTSGRPTSADASADASAPSHRPTLRLVRDLTFGFGAALLGGALLAAPQIVETLRILPRSSRGYWRYSADTILEMSWPPILALEQLTPLFFGAPATSPWISEALFYGNDPLIYSQHLGLATLALLIVAVGVRSRAAAWGWIALGLGLFLALGKHNPLMSLLIELPGASALRYPMRMWSMVTLGAAVLAGIGLERLLRSDQAALRRLRVAALLGLGLVVAALAGLVLPGAPLARTVAGFAPDELPPPALVVEAYRWGFTWLVQLALCAGLTVAAFAWRRAPGPLSALVLVLHLASQLVVLHPLLLADDASLLRAPPAALEQMPPGVVFHAALNFSFGDDTQSFTYDPEIPALPSRARMALAPYSSGIAHGRRYALSRSPEGLDSLFARALMDSLKILDDAQRVRILRSVGVDVLVAARPVDALDERGIVGRPFVGPGDQRVWIYALPDRPDDYFVARRVHGSPDMTRGLGILTAPDFDARHDVLLRASDVSVPAAGPGGTIRIVRDDPEHVVLEVDAAEGGVVVASERAWLPLWRATVDGEPADVLVANMYRMAVTVPPGAGRVELRVDRRPTIAALAVSATTALLLVGLALRDRRRRHA